jgi:hypothetical protein
LTSMAASRWAPPSTSINKQSFRTPKAANFAAFFVWAMPLKRIDPGGGAVRGPILKSMLTEELDLLLG